MNKQPKTKMEAIFDALRGGYTVEGIIDWFSRHRTQLGGRTPAQAIDDGDLEKVWRLALTLNEGMIAT